MLFFLFILAVYSRLCSCDITYYQSDDYPNVSPLELRALQDFFESTHGQYWRWNEINETEIHSYDPNDDFYLQRNITINRPIWNFTEELVNPCLPEAWQGIRCFCNNTCFVAVIALTSRNLSGTIPSSLSNLAELRALELDFNYLEEFPTLVNQHNLNLLDLRGNYFGGSIPSSIGLLANLKVLRLAFNGLSGTIPDSLGLLKKLEILNLNGNNISGSLDVLTNLSCIQILSVYDNDFHGSLPVTINNLRHLRAMNLRQNHIEGTLINELFEIQNLTSLDLSNNELEGTVPYNISQLTQLEMLNISANHFNGSFPEVLVEMTFGKLQKIYMADNQLTGRLESVLSNISSANVTAFDVGINSFTGTLPPLEFPQLQWFDASSNLLSGTLPVSLCNSTNLTFLVLSYNAFQNTIPACFANMTFEALILSGNQLNGTIPGFSTDHIGGVFEVDDNYLTGELPFALCSSHFHGLNVGGNFIRGTIPECFFDTIGLRFLNVSYNLMHGTIPNRLSDAHSLNSLALNHNSFSGTMPDLSSMPALVFLYIQHNKFTGPVVLHNVNPKNISVRNIKPVISFVDVSNNEFTGTLPTLYLKTSFSLVSLAAAANCLTGSIPDELCSLPDLMYLDFDGMSTSDNCRKQIFPGSKLLTSFTLTKEVKGGIPECLFNMPNLNTLHLSGNNILWSFPRDLRISRSLEYLDLSHNRLTGTIPNVIQNQPWKDLDLSYNKLVGTLKPSMMFPNNSKLTLKVNRLSGDIPSKLLNLQKINILTGNVFSCDFNRQGLPTNDPSYSNYQCGSNSFNQSTILWLCLFGFTLCIRLILVHKTGLPYLKRWETYADIVLLDSTFISFSKFVKTVCKYVLFCVVIIVGIFLPLNTGLSLTFSSQSTKYAWVVSAAYISGFVPGLTLTLSYMGFIVVLYFMWLKLKTKQVEFDHGIKFHWVDSNYQTLSLYLVMFINSVVTIVVNGGYVYVLLNKNATIITIAELLLAMFKLLWNEHAIKHLVRISRSFYKHKMDPNSLSFREFRTAQEMPFLTYMALFNSLIAPLIASAVVDPNCFVDAFLQPKPVTSSFPYFVCSYFQVQNGQCNSQTSAVSSFTVSYDPPFTYSYQCTSSIMTNYASVFVLLSLFEIFLRPPLLIATVLAYTSLPKDSLMYYWASKAMYGILKPANEVDLAMNRSIFHKDRFILRFISHTSILLTFGVLLPPLAVLLCGAYFTQSLIFIIAIGRFLSKIEDPVTRGLFKEALKNDTENCWGLFLDPMVRLVLPLVCLFYGLIVIDMYGDKVEWEGAIWMPSLIVAMPILLIIGHKIRMYLSKKVHKIEKRISQDLEDVSEVSEIPSERTSTFQIDVENPLRKSNKFAENK